MRSKFILAVLFCIILNFESGYAIPSDQIPYGIFANDWALNDLTGSTLDSLHNILGFNFAYACSLSGVDPNVMALFLSHGFSVIPYPTSRSDTATGSGSEPSLRADRSSWATGRLEATTSSKSTRVSSRLRPSRACCGTSRHGLRDRAVLAS